MIPLRHETHYGDRVVRCFGERPATIDATFRAAVARAPERDALVLDGARISYRALDAMVAAIAANLTRRGFRKGDRIALLLGNGFEFIYGVLACARAGIIVVPMSIRQRAPETEFILNQCAAAALIYQGDLAEHLPSPAATPHLRERFVVGDGAGTPFAALTTPASFAEVAIAEEDVFALLYTSGTTGRPKGAMLTHLGTIHSLLHFEHGMALRDGEVSVLAVPASHVTGLVAIILTMVKVAGTTVLMSAFKARAFLALAAQARMTHTLIVPAMYNLCLLDPEFATFDLSPWRIGGFGGAPMPEATIEKLAAILPQLTLINAYGSTETTSPVTLLPPGEAAAHADTVGKALPCADIIVMDDDGREVVSGASGELWIAGPMVVPGYWNNPEADRASFCGGYWKSGDIGSIDAQGYVRIHDRKKDMINRGGYKIYCIEVEGVLARHPGVIECAVIGRPDPVLGERVHAVIVPRAGDLDVGALKAFCAQNLSDYKVPESFALLSDALPRNANGKVLKTALRERS
ncbi:MAG TPA: class I adenylate-forming enzyme family protein [Xanthobacteraceae bacterium]|nr:class I adenylate-forming enzyme family protein [Xanthobacteraceae bacterium]